MGRFSGAKQEFDNTQGRKTELPHSLVPVDGKDRALIQIRGEDGKPLEEYYKWQFIYGVIHAGLYAKDYIGVEVRFPKGTKGAAPLKLDGAIFDDKDWLQHYNDYWRERKAEDLEWLNAHLLAVIEFKRGDKEINKVFTTQVKPAMRLKDPSDAYVMGIYYDLERLFLFHRRNGRYLRYDEAKNQKGERSQTADLSLHLPDPYDFIPSFDELRLRIHRPAVIDRSRRGIRDLDIITSIATVQVRDALSNVLRTLDKAGLVNQRGYEIIIETFALKIFDEKRNERNPHETLEFWVTDPERTFAGLHEVAIQEFIGRIQRIRNEAEVAGQYQTILHKRVIDWKNPDHVRAVVEICSNFQDFSFVLSSRSDLYQLVFYNFANAFQQQEKAQFLTPIPVIDFLVKIVNPRGLDTVLDPCCGIGDFLSLAYVNAQDKPDPWKLNDDQIYGADISGDMIALASLNMLLNGDGEAHLFHVPDKGSILWKISVGRPPSPVQLIPQYHKAGKWNNWPDKTRLMKFHVILTNPPFGEDRAYRPRTAFDRQVIEMYETWSLAGGNSIDLGVVFLENAYRCLRQEGRLGIVLSNSIASIDSWRPVREWLMDRMRVVGSFDLPSNVFAETGVNTTLIVAYKPKPEELQRLKKHGYSVFVRDIQHVGYERRTSRRNVFFNPVYRINEETFEIATDEEGHPVLEEDFTETVADFRQWALGQEDTLQRLFIREV